MDNLSRKILERFLKNVHEDEIKSLQLLAYSFVGQTLASLHKIT